MNPQELLLRHVGYTPAEAEALEHLVGQLETLRTYIRSLEVDLNAAGDENFKLRSVLQEIESWPISGYHAGAAQRAARAAISEASNPAIGPHETPGICDHIWKPLLDGENWACVKCGHIRTGVSPASEPEAS